MKALGLFVVFVNCFVLSACSQANEVNFNSIKFLTFSMGIQDLEEMGFNPNENELRIWSDIEIDKSILSFFKISNHSFLRVEEPIESQLLNFKGGNYFAFQCKTIRHKNNVWVMQWNIYKVENSNVLLVKSTAVEIVLESETSNSVRTLWEG